MKASCLSPSFWLVTVLLMRLRLVYSSTTLCRLSSCWPLLQVTPTTSWSSEFPLLYPCSMSDFGPTELTNKQPHFLPPFHRQRFRLGRSDLDLPDQVYTLPRLGPRHPRNPPSHRFLLPVQRVPRGCAVRATHGRPERLQRTALLPALRRGHCNLLCRCRVLPRLGRSHAAVRALSARQGDRGRR